MDVVTLRDQMARVASFSYRFFTAMAGNKAGNKNRALICSFMLRTNGKGEFFRVENMTLISRCE